MFNAYYPDSSVIMLSVLYTVHCSSLFLLFIFILIIFSSISVPSQRYSAGLKTSPHPHSAIYFSFEMQLKMCKTQSQVMVHVTAGEKERNLLAERCCQISMRRVSSVQKQTLMFPELQTGSWQGWEIDRGAWKLHSTYYSSSLKPELRAPVSSGLEKPEACQHFRFVKY